MTAAVQNRRMNELNYAMDAYLGDCARAGKTRDTLRTYRRTLWSFADFLEREGVIECDRISRDLCRRFLDRWVASSPSTMAQGHTVLTQFFRFLEAETVIDKASNPMDGIPRPKRQRPVVTSKRDAHRICPLFPVWTGASSQHGLTKAYSAHRAGFSPIRPEPPATHLIARRFA